MVLLFTHKWDMSTKKIAEWLDYYDEDFFCLQKGVDFIEISSFSIQHVENCVLNISNKVSVPLKDIKSVFFRGGHIRPKRYVDNILTPVSFEEHLRSFLHAYSVAQIELISKFLSSRFTIGNNGMGRYNKINALMEASNVGLKVPDSIITVSKEELMYFRKKHGRIITKSLDNNFSYYDKTDKIIFNQYTHLFSDQDYESIPEKFAPTLFQEYAEKAYEIRIFILLDILYPVAILSQLQDNTVVDVRNYDSKKMNRYVPCTLPQEIKNKLIRLMANCNLNTGSVDMIKSPTGEYYFLEVNPIGQFGYVSDACNYNIEHKIAQKLMTAHG